MAALNQKDIQEILKLFENELNLLIRKDKLEKMEIRRRIKDAIQPLSAMERKRTNIFMDIVEEKLHDVFDLFNDGFEFRRKLEHSISDILKKATLLQRRLIYGRS